MLLASGLAGGGSGLGKAAGVVVVGLAPGLAGGGIGSSIVAAMSSRGCAGVTMDDAMALLARSAAILVAAQKMGGEFVHPMGKTRGKATKGSCPSLTGKTTPSLGMSSTARLIW